MSKSKKFLVLLFVVIASMLFFACGEETTESTTASTTAGTTSVTTAGTTAVTTVGTTAATTAATTANPDTVAPVIVVNQSQVVIKTDSAFVVEGYITVTDNVSTAANIVVTISNWGGFDISVVGQYTVEISAEDEAGNISTATIIVIVKSDILAPMLTGSVSTITHLAGEVVNLTQGLTGVDNVDGVNVIFTVTDLGDYDLATPGTYSVQIQISDAAGNAGTPFARTVIVESSYSRAEMTSFDGDIIRFEALYNPQVFNGNTGTGYNSSYNGDYVNVLSKDYFEWLLEYEPERIGSGVGWSVIAVTDADNEIVYVRHWNSGEAYLEEGAVVSLMNVDWSTGTSRTWSETVNDTVIPRSNARYSSGEFGLMMANLLQWVPDDGHVFMFMNWTSVGLDGDQVVLLANTPDMPRSMGGNYIMFSDEDGDEIKDYALGRTLEILNPELSDSAIREVFDPLNPFPAISIPSKRYVNSAGTWKERTQQTVYLDKYTTENPYNPLDGITADDGKGTDISNQVTYKMYRFQTSESVYGVAPSVPLTDPLWGDLVASPWLLSENEVTMETALTEANDGLYFVVEYTVTANGYTDKAYKIIDIAADSPDYIDLYGDTDTVYSNVMGFEARLEMNPDLVSFGAFDQTQKGMIFTSDYYENLSTKPVLTAGVAVVLDEYSDIQTMRFLNGTPFEISKNGTVSTTGLLWDNMDLLAGIVVPDGGYLLVYPAGLDDSVMNKAFKAYYDYDYDMVAITTPMPKSGIVQVMLPIKEVQELSTLIVDDATAQVTVNSIVKNVEVINNNKTALVNSTAGGAGFRFGDAKVYYYDKDMYAAFLLDPEVVDSFTILANNLGVPWFNNGVIMIFDEDGNFVKARLGVGVAAEVSADGTFLFGAEVTNFDVTVYTADNLTVHGLLKDILTDVPDDGYFMIFPNTTSTTVRDLAIGLVWNSAYPGGGALVDSRLDPLPTNSATLGFDATMFTSAFFTDLAIEVDYVATIVDQPTKIMKPVLTLTGSELTWSTNTLANSYDLYVDGMLFEAGVGVASDDGLSYILDLASITMAEGTFDLQLRAITADGEVAATSVLSKAVSFTVERLDEPTNFARVDNVVSWDAVTGAASYFVSINEGEFVEVTTNSVTIPDEDIENGVIVAVYATGSVTLFDSLVAEYALVVEIIPMEIEFGPYTLDVKEFSAASWMRYVAAGDVGAQFINGFVVVNGAEGFLELDDATKVFAGGYAILFDADMNVKYIVDRWGHEWNPIDGWTTNAGGWTYGANLYVSYFRAHLAVGDIAVFASQYSGGLEAGTYRNYFGNAFIFDLGVVTTDHRAVDLLSAIDPTAVTVEVREKIMTATISMGLSDLPVVAFDLDTWINYIDPLGSNDIGAANIAGMVLVNGAFGITLLDDTQKIFGGGYAAILDSDMNIKYIVDRWGHEWNAVDGWTSNAGGWTYGATLYASYFKAHLADGDMLLLASQYSGGLPTGTYRNYFGNAFIKDLGVYSTDHRAVDLLTAKNPAIIIVTIKQTQSVMRIGNELMSYKSVALADWMGSYAISDPGAASIHELVVLTDLETISNYLGTDKIFAGGYAILLDSSMNVKYIVDRWGNEWNPIDGWTVNATAWTFGANVFVSYINTKTAAGDILILGGQYDNGLAPGASFRDVIGNQIFFDLGVAIYSGDHRAVLVADAIDPTTVVIEIQELS